jgi:lipopolysaccharide transport system ATP-binding protein
MHSADYSIIVKGLSKKFRIKRSENMLREVLSNFIKGKKRKKNIEKDMIWALNDISLSVKKGEILGIIGRNGAGKSTLLKILSRISCPTEGEIHVNGKIGALLEVGTGFHEELTGRENIFLNGSILGMTKREITSKMDNIVDFADVEKFLDTPIKHYSSGMRLRLGFAVAAHLDTDVLLVDEVLAVGDIGFQKRCTDKIGDLRDSGRTILFVSHQMAAVENLCTRAIWIDGGKIKEDGKTKEIIKKYMATYSGVSNGGQDLCGVENRRGNGLIKYKYIEFMNKERKAVNVIQSGDNLIIRLHYYAEKRVQNNIAFGIQIFSDLGTLVTTVDSSFVGNEISILHEGDGYVEAEIDFLYLMPGRYYISLWIDNNSGIIYEHLDHCIKLDIEEADFYKTGFGITSRHGIIFLPYKWNLHNLKKELN